MLVLKLRRGERTRIGPHVSITVLRESGDAWLVVGIEAPPEWRISREPGDQHIAADGLSSLAAPMDGSGQGGNFTPGV